MMENQGGSGGTCIRNERQMRLVERALRERWRISKPLRGSLVDRVGRILDDPNASPREVTAAAKAILSASKLNLENVTVACKALEYLDLEGRVREIEEIQEQRKIGQTW